MNKDASDEFAKYADVVGLESVRNSSADRQSAVISL